ncbi:MAG: CPBP family intramembrane glutamic endopeptidase [Actinomycetota bacterium]
MSPPIPPRPDTGGTVSDPIPTTMDGRPRSTWGWFEAVGIYLLAFLAGGFASLPVLAVLGDTSLNGAIGRTEILATIVADGVIVGVLVFWLARWHREWRAAMVLPPARERIWRDLLYGAIAGLILVPAVGIISGGIEAIFRQAVGHQVTTPEQVAPGLSPLASGLLVVLAVAIAPISEELFFRGVLFRTVRDRHGFWAAALASAIPFGLVHYVPSPAIDALVLQLTMVFTGIGLAWIYERRGSIVASMAAHVAFNVVGLVVILGVVR